MKTAAARIFSSPMTPEGRIVVDLFPAAGSVRIASSRPLGIARAFSRQRPEEVLRSVSILFAACRAAQSFASAEAFEGALGITASRRTQIVRSLLILAETAREHAVRVVIDWPKFLHTAEAPQAAPLQRLMRISRDLALALDENKEAARLGGACVCQTGRALAVIADLRAFLEQAVFGESLDRWLGRGGVEDLAGWAFTGGTAAQKLIAQLLADELTEAGAADVSALPPMPSALLAERLFAGDPDAFVAKPDWQGQARETSPLARRQDHPLVGTLRIEAGFGVGARLLACLVELAHIPARMFALFYGLDADSPFEDKDESGGIGVAQVEAARGRLVHAVCMDGERVRQYRILAPTEWNFHPDGAAARGLANIAASGADRCGFLARLFVTAVDPCVGYEVRVC